MTRAWALALRNLRRNRRRNLATAVAIALGTAGLVLLGGYIARIEAFLRANSVYVQHRGHLTIYKEGGLAKAMARPARYSLSADEQAAILEAIRTDRRVDFVGRYLRGMGLAGNGCRTVPFIATGVEPAVERRLLEHPQVERWSGGFGRPLQGRLLSESGDVEGPIGLAAGLARLLGKHRLHDAVPRTSRAVVVPDCTSPDAAALIAGDANVQLAGMSFDGSLSAVDGDVVNVFHTPTAETEDQTLVTTLETLQRLYATDAVTFVAVYLKRWQDATRMAPELQAHLRASGVRVDVYPFTDERTNLYYVGSMAFLGSLVSFIVVLVGAVVALGVMNAVTLTVFERTRELGTFRALGYTRRQVVMLLVREVAILAGVSVAVGIALALATAAAIYAADIRFMPPGVPGTVQLIVAPGWEVCTAVTALLLPLSVLVTWIVVRRRVRERTADLLTATAA